MASTTRKKTAGKTAGRKKTARAPKTVKSSRRGPAARGGPASSPGSVPAGETPPRNADPLLLRPIQLPRLPRVPRQVWGGILLLLALCVVIGWSGSDAILIRWLEGALKGLFGYGYLISVLSLTGAGLILLFYRGPRVWLRAGTALLLVPLEGILAHLFFYDPIPHEGEAFDYGLMGDLRDLWDTGLGLRSGGLLSGAAAQAGITFLSRPVTAILCLCLCLTAMVVALWPLLLSFLRAPDPGEEGSAEIREDDPGYDPDPDPDPDLAAWMGSERPSRRPKASQQIDFPLDDDPPPPPAPVPRRKPEVPALAAHTAPSPRTASAPRAEPTGADAVRPSGAKTGGEYRIPSLTLLREERGRKPVGSAAELARNAQRLEDTLTSFSVAATPAGDPVQGPAVTRYDFTLEQGVKLSKLTNLSDDIALALGAPGVRIAPIPERNSVVGIEVPNRQVTPVLLRDVLSSRAFSSHRSSTAFALGRDISGADIVGSIEDLPHVLIAGTTGSGKSVCTNALIISLLYKSAPEDVRFIMIDPKMVELAPYNGIPHLLVPVVTDPRKAAGALQWAVTEMMRRYRIFSERGVKDRAGYNARKDTEPLPSVVVVVDELADLMLAAAKEVEESIVRIAQMGRAAGIHLVISTQRPSADVITGLMKANIPSRIAFAVASAMESRIILDGPGAEKLVGKGDMLYAPLGEGRIRVQGCYISPGEIERVVTFVKQTSEARYDDGVMESIDASARVGKPSKDGGGAEEEAQAVTDEMLPAAVDVVLETGQASVSMLQRRLKLGYSRAARLVDQMEELGYVGPFEGSHPRKLKLTKEKWQEIKMTGVHAAAR